MKLFVKKLVIFPCMSLIVFVMMCVLSALPPFQQFFAHVTLSSGYHAGEMETDSVIQAVRKKDSYEKLIVGDCVCKQMFDKLQAENDIYLMAGNNHALTMAGEYLLIREFLENHEDATEVLLLVGPYTLESEMSSLYGYQYFAGPFSKAGLINELDKETYAEACDTFGVWALNPTVAELITNSSLNQKIYLNYLLRRNQDKDELEKGQGNMSGETIRYLPRIKELCDAYGVELSVLSPPLADTADMRMQMENFALEWEKYGMNEMFPEYFESVRYYPAEQFPDGIHYGNGYERQKLMNEVIREMYCEQGYMEGIVLSD